MSTAGPPAATSAALNGARRTARGHNRISPSHPQELSGVTKDRTGCAVRPKQFSRRPFTSRPVMPANENNRVSTIDALRGIASLAVCWFHLTNGNPKFLPDGALKASGAYGWLGVEAFFVISGFVIPFSLYRSGHELKDYPRFLYKRVVRQ